MIVPLSYFIEKPFQNWTRTGNELIGSVFLYVDHTAPVEAIREKLAEIASQSKLWNGKVVSLQVSDCKETTIELRAFVSADNASAVWDLRCEVREKLIDFLQREYPTRCRGAAMRPRTRPRRCRRKHARSAPRDADRAERRGQACCDWSSVSVLIFSGKSCCAISAARYFAPLRWPAIYASRPVVGQ